MDSPAAKKKPKRTSRVFPTSRRDFLKLSAAGALAAGSSVSAAETVASFGARLQSWGAGNTRPGRIVLYHDTSIDGHVATIDRDATEAAVHHAVRILTGITDDTGAAFESLFPGVSSTSTFAIKVNCIGPTCTRWEVARGVVSGLSLMLGGTYDVSHVTIYDRHNIGSYGYDTSEFTFNGNYPTLSNTNNASGSGQEPWPGHDLSRYILNCDYLINIPALKSHSNMLNQITVALKNHYGSCAPASLCGNIPGMLSLNSFPALSGKAFLTVTDAVRATWTGGPGESPQTWNTFAEGTPNTIFATTDPSTNDYWARDYINTERAARSYGDKPAPWVEESSGDPYYIGISDPALMQVVNFDTAGVSSGPRTGAGVLLSANTPNPFRDRTTLRFFLTKVGSATLSITDASGRLVKRLAREDFPGGWNKLQWDGRGSNGRKVAPGVYFLLLDAEGQTRSRRMIVAR
jgi:hypothetical protein